jgi:hypothetical protein
MCASLCGECADFWCPAPSPLLQDYLRSLFNRLDENHDGKLDMEEFRAAMRALGDELSGDAVRYACCALTAARWCCAVLCCAMLPKRPPCPPGRAPSTAASSWTAGGSCAALAWPCSRQLPLLHPPWQAAIVLASFHRAQASTYWCCSCLVDPAWDPETNTCPDCASIIFTIMFATARPFHQQPCTWRVAVRRSR